MDTEKMDNSKTVASTKVQSKPAVKSVRNRSSHRIELVIEGKVVVFMPGKSVEVPENFVVPNGLGLYVR